MTEPDDVRRALALLVERCASGTPPGESRPALRAESIDGAANTRWALLHPMDETPRTILAEGYACRYRIATDAAHFERGRLLLPPPATLECLRSRGGPRVAAPPDAFVCFDHPHGGGRRIERPLVDFSAEGLCFTGGRALATLQPGSRLSPLLLCLPGREPIALQAELRSRRLCAVGNVVAVGCHVAPCNPDDAQRLRLACDELLFPATRRGASDVWPVYVASGYFELSDTLGGGFEHLRRANERAARCLAAAPELGCQASWPACEEPLATASNVRLLSRTWLSFHLAIKPDAAVVGQATLALREVYRRYLEHARTLAGARWQMAYVQHDARWSQRIHVATARRHAASGEALVQAFRALEVRTSGWCALAHSWEVEPASELELAQVIQLLNARRSAVYCDALDYHVASFGQAALAAQWARAGLQRERELLVARDGARLLAAAVVDCAEPGLHLFGLLDSLRVYSLHETGERAFPALLDAARSWFRQRGRASFCYLQEEGEFEPGPGIEDMGGAWLTVLSLERVPDMLEHLYRETVAP